MLGVAGKGRLVSFSRHQQLAGPSLVGSGVAALLLVFVLAKTRLRISAISRGTGSSRMVRRKVKEKFTANFEAEAGPVSPCLVPGAAPICPMR